MNNPKQTVYCYDLHVNGIFGRKRKPQRELFTLVKHSPVKLDTSEIIQTMESKLAELKLKGSYKLVQRLGQIDGEFYTTTLFADQTILTSGVKE